MDTRRLLTPLQMPEFTYPDLGVREPMDVPGYSYRNKDILDRLEDDMKSAADDKSREWERMKENKKSQLDPDQESDFLEEGDLSYSHGVDRLEKMMLDHNAKIPAFQDALLQGFSSREEKTADLLVESFNAHLASQSNAINHFMELELGKTLSDLYKDAFYAEYIQYERNGMERMTRYLKHAISHHHGLQAQER